jgi:hypothetical protein
MAMSRLLAAPNALVIALGALGFAGAEMRLASEALPPAPAAELLCAAPLPAQGGRAVCSHVHSSRSSFGSLSLGARAGTVVYSSTTSGRVLPAVRDGRRDGRGEAAASEREAAPSERETAASEEAAVAVPSTCFTRLEQQPLDEIECDGSCGD